MTLLAVSIQVKNLQAALDQVSLAASLAADIVELRLDYIEDLPGLNSSLIEKLITNSHSLGLKTICTCRDHCQGGARHLQPQTRLGAILSSIAAGSDFVDCEYINFKADAFSQPLRSMLSKYPACRLILSEHDFQKPFGNLPALYASIKAAFSQAIPKMVYHANHITDIFPALDLLNRHARTEDLIVFAMGPDGLISRIVARKLGCFLTFAALDQASCTAPGQVSAQDMKSLFRFDSINTDTELYGVVASPVKHSMSPAIHNAAFANLGLNKLYLPILLTGQKPQFESFFNSLLARPWLSFRGFSVTLPHKETAFDYIKNNQGFIEPAALKIGAINTVLLSPDGSLSGYNTDCPGALGAIISGMALNLSDLRGLETAVVGAGGVARAIVAGLALHGARITIYNRTLEKALALASDFSCSAKPLSDLPSASADLKLLINCTSIGMHPLVDESPVPPEILRPGLAVFDTIYNPLKTKLLRHAQSAGCKTISGLDMFILQAAAQFELFTSKSPDTALMRQTVLNCLASR